MNFQLFYDLLTPNYRSQGIHGTAHTDIYAENVQRNFK